MHIVYFSPTGGTRKAAYIIGKEIDPQATEIDITDHTRQQNSYELNGEDILLVAVPVYGGRVPSVAIDRLKRITGYNTPAILVVVYGNRDYDDALLELKTTMESNGFQTVACIACIAEHSIMRVYAKGRPDSDDETILKNFSEQIKTKLVQLKNGESFTEIQVKGNADYKIYINSALWNGKEHAIEMNGRIYIPLSLVQELYPNVSTNALENEISIYVP